MTIPSLVMVLTLLTTSSLHGWKGEKGGPRSHTIRVRLLSQGKKVGISSPGGAILSDEGTGKRVAAFHRGKNLIFSADDGKLLIDGYESPAGRVLVKPVKTDELIRINNAPYRGEVSLSVNERKSLNVVNIVDLEEYLYGLLPYEISPDWEMEALKAQAVIARTYALNKIVNGGGDGYHLTANQFDQVYKGYQIEAPRTNAAVDSTRGLILASRESLVPAFYHATCGGITAEASEVWSGTEDHSKSVRCNFCINSPHYSWSAEIDLKDLTEPFRKRGYQIGEITRVAPVQRGHSGRVQMLLVDHKGGAFIINANKFRLIVGPKVVKSTLFQIYNSPGKLLIEGNGWGHGVGLCQWGAKGMAEKGHNFKEIINFYFKDVEIIERNSLAGR